MNKIIVLCNRIGLPEWMRDTPKAVYYYTGGKLHRDNGPALIIKESKEWYRNGIFIDNG